MDKRQVEPMGECHRQSAKRVLEDMIVRTEKRAEALVALHRAIHWDDVSERDENLLWGLLADLPRRIV